MSSGKLRELRGRIRSVIAIQQTTRAMRMIAAVKLRKAQERLYQLRPYRQSAERLMHTLLSALEEPHPYQLANPDAPALYVVLSSSRGLCGAFNSSLLRWIQSQLPSPDQVHLVCLGKKAYEGFRKSPYSVELVDLFGGKDVSVEAIYAQAQRLWQGFSQGTYSQVVLLYNRFGGVGKALPTREAILPLSPPKNAVDFRPWLYEPSLSELITAFVPRYVTIALSHAVQESLTAEHSARMVAMQMATDNAEELLRTLRLQYNKARQASITKELLEIVAGAEALKK
ncbi:MAG: ATP synthase F1 subunit gamma [Bacteroidia bacterium]|nr:ATP synthase F1 subunit gamma [Bacteroidia bacterium]MDW8088812.1 ATP synthase F1 subunit gamma [Bacteroidia bacterium]